MEQEGTTNFKALRAKFQEEANLAQARNNRPVVAEKPRSLSRPRGHCSSVVSCIQAAAENKTPVVPRIIFRDGLRASGGKRPISFPPQPPKTSPSTPHTGGDSTTTKQSLRDRNLPLVLPVPPVKEHKAPATKEHELEQEPLKEVPSSTKIKKKGLLLPFKSTRVSKANVGTGEEPTNTYLTIRPARVQGELSFVERQRLDEEFSVQGDRSTTKCPPSSPEIVITSPPAGTNGDTNNIIISTLERAKRKFSYRQLLTYTKPKRSPEAIYKDKAPPLPPESTEPDLLVSLPVLACVSARPFIKVNSSAHKSALDKQLGKDTVALTSVRPDECHLPVAPPKLPLPDLKSLGPLPVKPPRPPHVDLSCYHPTRAPNLSDPSCAPCEEAESDQQSITSSVLEAPEFPDFENSEIETAECPAVDIAALELEAFDLVNFECPAIDDFGVTNLAALEPDRPACEPTQPEYFDQQGLSLGVNDLRPFDSVVVPDPLDLSGILEPIGPKLWSQNNEVVSAPIVEPQTEEIDLGPAETHSVTEETDLGNHAASNDVIQPQPSASQQGSYHKACDNVYEDVENVNKLIASQISRKYKGSLKNPYATSSKIHAREEARLNIWPRNPWSTIPGEHGHLIHAHLHSKECQNPDNADCKEQRKKEKHRLEKEKKEQKEQKEREKRENEMKKKYKVTGEEEPMYHAKVMVACKVRKNDLPVKSGDTVGIIRTTNCPKGKWLARDANHKYGYISVMNVELNIKEMLVLGKKVQAAGKGGNMEGDTISIGSRSSNHPILSSSFTDDSEEWACEEDAFSFSTETHSFHQQTVSMPENLCSNANAPHMLSDANLEVLHIQPSHEALQKLATFFQHKANESSDITDSGGATLTNAEPPSNLCAIEEPPYSSDQEVDFTDLMPLPPPPLYADCF